MAFDQESLKNFPQEPGVYLMKNDTGTILYIGKAKDLRSRVKQYFFSSSDTREMIPLLIAQIESIQTIITLSEKEALILENNLIKQHQPKYNVLLKDDKTFISLSINHQHKWPMIKLVRCTDKPKDDALYFGPYPSTYSARKTLEVLQKIFPLRQCSDYELTHRKKPCLLYEMKRCLAPCVNKCSHMTYQNTVKEVISFLKGKNSSVLEQIMHKIDEASKSMEYEQAQALYSIYKQVKEIHDHHQFAVQMKIEDCDVIGYHEMGPKALVVLFKFRDEKLIESKSDFFSCVIEEKEKVLEEYLLQRYLSHTPPETVILPFLIPESKILKELLEENHRKKIEFIYPLKGQKRLLLEMANKNSSTLFKQQLSLEQDYETLLIGLQEKLELSHMPMKIECFDTSNCANIDSVAAMIVAIEGKIEKKKTRLFKIKNHNQADDYTALKEVLKRRYEKALEDDDLPDLIVIDGGKGQLNLASAILKELNIASCDLISIVKEDSRHDKGLRKERIFTTNHSESIDLGVRSPLLFFLQKMRDEAHRVAIGYHRKVRSKSSLKSGLDEIKGIGPVKKKRLLTTFGSLKNIEKASDQDLLSKGKISKKDLESLRNYFRLSVKNKSQNPSDIPN